ncbi:hypothetical protein M408DRAFT_27336 [Serendipita vermifera MAFF 305830]|uniref:RBR-type E3 ubiquitin transferase n=1 Tax=Serendipita vermifera MAFF 305830 TaxID=933852 RepID=A0A0C3AHC1_SERVB|nr:hypothetical protein M408DRAFT_27336 [Serendipita vermifera MAFF 305830]
MSSDTLAFGEWDVTFTDGASISSIKERREYTDILLTNLSSSFTNAQLQTEIARFGSASVMRDSRRKRARVRFLDAGVAAAAMIEMDNKRLGLSRVEATLDRSKDTHWIEDGLLLEYDRCQTAAVVSFVNAEEANVALNFNRSMFQGRRLRVTREDETSVLVEELPAIFDPDDLVGFFMAHTVSVTRDYAGDDEETNFLLQSLIREQPGCAHLTLTPLGTGFEEGAAWIRMANDERAADVSREIRGLRPIFLHGNIVQAQRSQAVVWKLVKDQYAAVKSLVENAQFEGVYLIHFAGASETVEIRAISADSRKLRVAKPAMDTIVKGEIWQTDEAPLWDRNWVTEVGRGVIDEVNRVSAAYVYADLAERTIRIAGQDEARECAKVMLQTHLDALDAQRHRIKLPAEIMEYFVEHGMHQLADTLARFDSTIGRSTDIEFRGTDIARQKLYTVIDQCSAEVKIRSVSTPRPTCPVCTTEVVEPLTLFCGHSYCSECLVHLVTSALDFPIECITQDCRHTLSLRSIERIISPLQYRRLLETSFRMYLRGHETLHECPNPDCTQLWTASESEVTRLTQCLGCLARICTRCRVEEHNGMSCEEFQRSKALHRSERLLATWRAERGNDVKACPNCGALSEKIDGCPHIHCPNCKRHWCWECSRSLPRAELVYAHIRRRHNWAAERFLAPLNM